MALTLILQLFMTSLPVWIQPHLKALKRKVFFNMTIRIVLESYIEIALTSAVNLKNVRAAY
jgi:hypothetical protein